MAKAEISVPPGETVVDAAFLARLFDMTERNVQYEAKEGRIVKAGHGKYYLIRSITAYTKYLRAVAASHQSADGKIDAVEESALLKRANREIVEIKRAALSGQLVNIVELTEIWVMVMQTIRSMLIAVPNRVAFSRPHMTPDDIKAIRKECEEVLRVNSLSNPGMGPLPDPSKT